MIRWEDPTTHQGCEGERGADGCHRAQFCIFCLRKIGDNARLRIAHLEKALAPFAEASRAHGVRQGKDDLWVSLGVAGSAWVRAREALKEGTE